MISRSFCPPASLLGEVSYRSSNRSQIPRRIHCLCRCSNFHLTPNQSHFPNHLLHRLNSQYLWKLAFYQGSFCLCYYFSAESFSDFSHLPSIGKRESQESLARALECAAITQDKIIPHHMSESNSDTL